MPVEQTPQMPAPAKKNPWIRTPLIESTNLSKAAGCRILLKLDNLQPSGSFKLRGIGHHLQSALARSPHPERVHFYCSSGGNAGLACVHAAQALGRPATVVVPVSTGEAMVAKLRAAGAEEVLRFGVGWREADGYLRGVVMKRAELELGGVGEAVYVHPFEGVEIWDGHATLVEEVAVQMRELGLGEQGPGVVVCSVGGGGLFNGVVQGVEALGRDWEGTTVLAVETRGAESLARALEAGELVTLPAITSRATSLGAATVSRRAFELARKYGGSGRVRTAVLSDAEAAMGCWRFADDERMVVELACGVSLALCYGGRLEKALGRAVGAGEVVVIVVCGGQNVTTGMVEGWRAEFGDLDLEVGAAESQSGDVPSAVTAVKGA
ncbi:hypothetical protein LTR08_008188 [Meristemomyces frigidus]|nr:hypothetical protein LTR08_008188 [Meristemomyces frigidus]